MNAGTLLKTRHAGITLPTALLLVFLVGCDDDTVSPCYDCPPNGGSFVDVTEEVFAVGEEAVVRVDGFAGKVTYRTGEAGIIRVVATRRAEHRADLDHIDLDLFPHPAGLDITAENPMNLRNASVDLEITAPPDATPRVRTGVGAIDYKGRPAGNCSFRTGVGSIRLWLPADVRIGIELTTGIGSIFLDLDVDGYSSNLPHVVRGTIGGGGDDYLHASTGVGNVYLLGL